MARFTLHAQDLEQSKQLFEEWFDTTGWWNPVALGERIGSLREKLDGSCSSISTALEQAEAQVSNWDKEGLAGAEHVHLPIYKSLAVELKTLHDSTLTLLSIMEESGNKLMSQDEASNIYGKLAAAMAEADPSSFEELEQEMKSIVDKHQDELDNMNSAYASERDVMIGACNLEEFDAIASKCAEVELPNSWSAELHDVVSGINGLPEDPTSEF